MTRELCISGVEIDLHEAPLLGPIDCAVKAGWPLTLMGPSGSGKSTLLNWMVGSLPPGLTARGRILLDGDDITDLPPHRRRLGILFQDDLLFPHLTVAENLAFALPGGMGRAAKEGLIQAALAEAELPGHGARDPAGLSGGERARIALMRTLLAEPKALLLDEPFAKLDVALRERFRGFVFAKAAERNLPVLLVSHDPADSAAAGGLTIHLDKGPPAAKPAERGV
ncbi:ATP-binding cassette domain-containing protein [Dongia sp.]|uniref:ATP-binding cassette domain-containing protein n=1 Tax=Dongia sp. TaxID=1977262 RepID=UPI0035AF2C72